MNHRGGKSGKVKIVLGTGILFAYCVPGLLAADSITGVVRNQTHGQPAAGDEVILLKAGQGAQEEARAKTDSQGAFTLALQDPHKPHVVRVIHQGVNYDRQVETGDTISIDVADAAAKVKGITGGIEIVRVGTHGNLLHVTDMVEIRNLSSPQITQASERTFEVYLPSDAKIDSVLAAGPEDIGVMISATPVRGEAGHYTVNFPLRPGATKFAFNYDVPYDGRATFRTKNIYSLQQLAIMIPPTMTFVSGASAFHILPVNSDRYHVEAAEQVKAGESLEFEVSGAGALPALQSQVRAPQAQSHATPQPLAGSLTAPSLPTQPGLEAQGGNGNALGSTRASRSSAPSSRLQWWVLGTTGVLMLATFVSLVWRRMQLSTSAVMRAARATGQAGQRSASLVDALKEGLFLLETDRLQGAIPKGEYASVKQALEGTIEWALARTRVHRGSTPN